MKYLVPAAGKSFRISILLPDLDSYRTKLSHSMADHMLLVETSKDVEGLLKELGGINTEYLVVSDAAFWKKLTKKRKTTGLNGYVLPCVIKGYEHMQVVYAPLPLLHDRSGFEQGIQTAVDHWQGCYKPPGSEVTVTKLRTLPEIKQWLIANVQTPLAADTETFSLKHWSSGIGSIAFATSSHHAVAFLVDLGSDGPTVRRWLRQWFEARNAWTLWHNATFDAYILTYQLWMQSLRDMSGLRTGLSHITRGIQCSKIVSYCALNSAQEISLKLKDLAQEFLGDWAVDDITDITKIDPEELLDYNGHDACAAFWTYEQHKPTMVADQQEEVYETLLKPAITDIIEMQIVGIPFSMKRVKRVHRFLTAFQEKALRTVLDSTAARLTGLTLAQKWADGRNAKLKKKRVTADDWPETFNIGSDKQLAVMLFEVMGLPVLETTPSGGPSTTGDVLDALVNHTDNPEHIAILKAMQDWRDAQKLLTAFFPALLSSPQAEDGWHYLCGSYNIGGTLSGRLSSSGPNMQNQPSSGARFAKVYKYMFCAPPGWIFVGADFNALEDRVDALKTKDPNKLAVYTKGFDGHSWRACFYFSDKIHGIDIEDPVSVKTVGKLFPKERQDSKAPYFALTYQGTWKTLVKNCGFTIDVAKKIENGHKEMYKVAEQRTQEKLTLASKQGYLDVAFGIRVRTPLLQKYGLSLSHSQAEGRTVGNAWGQSYGLLNTRSGTAFLKQVRAENRPVYPCAQIHDAQYYLTLKVAEHVLWINQRLTKEMQWQELDEIRHPEVGLSGELDVFRFSWAKGHTLKNNASLADVQQVLFP
jgi:DNA polymerase-1